MKIKNTIAIQLASVDKIMKADGYTRVGGHYVRTPHIIADPFKYCSFDEAKDMHNSLFSSDEDKIVDRVKLQYNKRTKQFTLQNKFSNLVEFVGDYKLVAEAFMED